MGATSSKAAASAFGESIIRIGTPVISEQLKVPEGRAERAMLCVVKALFVELARTTVYIPAAYDSRNEEIYDKYHQPSRGAAACSHDRLRQLAAEYGLTSRAVYNVIRQLRQMGRIAPGATAGADATAGQCSEAVAAVEPTCG